MLYLELSIKLQKQGTLKIQGKFNFYEGPKLYLSIKIISLIPVIK